MTNNPHGGELKDLVERDKSRKSDLLKEASSLAKLKLTERQLCDVELLLNGGFSPLQGFMNEKDYMRVVSEMRLASGVLWPMPITLDLSEAKRHELDLETGERIVLVNPQDDAPLAILTVEDVYIPDKVREAVSVYGADDNAHPAVQYLHDIAGAFYVGGTLEAIQLPSHYDYAEHRFTPSQLRQWFEKMRWDRVVAFQTRNPMHRAHRELTVRAAREQKCNVLIHPVVGLTKTGDIDYHTRVKVYKAVLAKYPQGMAALSLLPLAMRMGGPREALWHSIIRKNYGCSHFIIGRDHAGPGKNSQGKDFYGPYDAQNLVEKYKSELHIEVVPFQMVSYFPEQDEYVPADQVPVGKHTLSISGTELRHRLKTGTTIPDWFTYKEVEAILRSVHPPRSSQGFAIIVIGAHHKLVATAGRVLETALHQISGNRSITLLSAQNALSPHQNTEDKDVEQLAFVASELTKARAAVVISADLRTDQSRKRVIERIKQRGNGGVFVVYLDDVEPTEDEKLQPGYFEVPENADIIIESKSSLDPIAKTIHEVTFQLERHGFIGA